VSAVLTAAIAAGAALLGGALTELVRGRSARAQAQEATEAKLRELAAAQAHEEQRQEMARLRGRVDALEQRLERMQGDLLTERERASRHRIAAAELEAAARGCPRGGKGCPVLARAEMLNDGPQAQED